MRILLFNRLAMVKKKIYLRGGESDVDWDDESLYDASQKPGGRQSHKGDEKGKKGGKKRSETMIEQDLVARAVEEASRKVETEKDEDPPVVGNGESVLAALEKTVLAEDGDVVATTSESLSVVAKEITEKELRDEKIKYLATGLVDDLKIYYGGPGDKIEATRRLDKYHIAELRRPDSRKDYAKGNFVTAKLGQFFRGKGITFPNGWENALPNFQDMGFSIEDLIEAKEKWVKKDENGKKEVVLQKEVNVEPIWYEEIVKDLREATGLNSTDEVRKGAIDKLKANKVKFPAISIYNGTPGDLLRLKIASAADFLEKQRNPRYEVTNNRWQSEAEALAFLKEELGVGKEGEVKAGVEAKESNFEKPIVAEAVADETEKTTVDSAVLSIYTRAILSPDFRKTRSYSFVRSRLEGFGIDVEAILRKGK